LALALCTYNPSAVRVCNSLHIALMQPLRQIVQGEPFPRDENRTNSLSSRQLLDQLHPGIFQYTRLHPIHSETSAVFPSVAQCYEDPAVLVHASGDTVRDLCCAYAVYALTLVACVSATWVTANQAILLSRINQCGTGLCYPGERCCTQALICRGEE